MLAPTVLHFLTASLEHAHCLADSLAQHADELPKPCAVKLIDEDAAEVLVALKNNFFHEVSSPSEGVPTAAAAEPTSGAAKQKAVKKAGKKAVKKGE